METESRGEPAVGSEVRPLSSPIAVVGLGAMLPQAADLATAWANIVSGVDSIVEVPASRWRAADYFSADRSVPDTVSARRGGFLPTVEFEPGRYGIPPACLPAIDTSQLLALLVAERTLADCAAALPADRDRVSVILGASWLDRVVEAAGRLQRPVWAAALREAGVDPETARDVCDRIASKYVPWQEDSFSGLLTNVISGRIANRFDLHGANHTVDAACASSLAAVYSAIAELSLGRADLVLTGGVDTCNDVTMFTCFSQTQALSPSGKCRPFSAAADGTLLGEAVVMFALKRLPDAERDGDNIYAVISGIGASSDGLGAAVHTPRPAGQILAVRRAYRQAGYSPATVGLVEAHGTGTVAGDAAEVETLQTVFGESGGEDRGWCALGSIKSQIGHTKSAAGAVGLLKTVLALHHRVLPPTIKIDQPNAALDLHDGPFFLNTTVRPWVHTAEHPRRAAVSAFGFGGTNFHVTLQEYRRNSAVLPRRIPVGPQLVLFSAANAEALARAVRDVDTSRPLSVTAAESRRAFRRTDALRLAVVAGDIADLLAKLAAAGERIARAEAFSAPGIHLGNQDISPGRVGFVFPGQGSQYLNMGADVAVGVPAASASWDRTSGLLAGDLPLHRVVFPPAAFDEATRRQQQDRLTATEWAQPALAAHSAALLAVLARLEVVPDCLAGHSFGELAAMYAGGAFDVETLVALARRRGELMRDAAAVPGAMMAVAADAARVQAIVGDIPEVWLANYNSPRQIVLAGTREGLDAAEKLLVARGIRTTSLQAATAFHSPLVASAAGPLREFLRASPVRAPRIEVFSGADAEPYPDDPEEIRRRLADQLIAPVRFQDVAERMYAAGVRTFVEVGPGAVLTGLIGHILGDRDHAAIALDRKGRDGMVTLLDGLGLLASRGVAMNYEALESNWEFPEPATGRFTVAIDGGNYGRPFPSASGLAGENGSGEDGSANRYSRREGAASTQVHPPVVAAQSTPPTSRRTVSPRATAPTSGRAVSPRATAPDSPRAIAPEPPRRNSRENTSSRPQTPGPAAPRASSTGFSPAPAAADTALVTPVSNPLNTRPAALPAGLADPVSPSSEPVLPMSNAASNFSENDNWLGVVEAAQRHMAEAHAAFQTALTDSHQQYLHTADATLAGLLELAGNQPRQPRPPSENHSPTAFSPVTPAPANPLPTPPAPAAIPTPPTLAPPTTPHSPPRPPAPSPTPLPAQQAPAAWETSPPQAEPAPPKTMTVEDVSEILLAVMADRTGYPVEMLNADMDLETDIGIDSIKRVEVLSALKEQVSDAGLRVDIVEFAGLRTTRAIAAKTVSPDESAPGESGNATPELSVPEFAVPPALPVSVHRAIPRPVAAPAARMSMPGLSAHPVVVTDDQGPIAALVVAGLRDRGIAASVVTRVPSEARSVVLLEGLRAVESVDDAIALNRTAFESARSSGVGSGGGVFVTVQDTGGEFGTGQSSVTGPGPWSGGMSALARTVAAEWPHTAVKALDIARAGRDPEVIAAAIVDELVCGGPELAVGLAADGTRTTVELLPVSVVEGAGVVGPDSVLVVAGGGRGITAAAVQALARAHRPRMVLLGRHDLTEEPEDLRSAHDEPALLTALSHRPDAPSNPAAAVAAASAVLAGREVRQTLEQLRGAGSSVRYVSVDVRDRNALSSALDDVRAEWGPITGVIHGAGVLADSPIADKTDEQFARAFGTKVDGLRALLEATASDPLTLVCAFSSITAYAGNPGQSDYAMANEVLNQVLTAEQAKRPECLIRSIGWGPWRAGMIDDTLAARLGAKGWELLEPQDGVAAFLAELSDHGPVRVAITAGNESYPVNGQDGQISADIVVTSPEYDYLHDHAVGGTPVVPVATVLDWFASLARSWQPGTTTATLYDLRVLDKIAVPELDSERVRLSVRGHEATGPEGRRQLDLDLRDDTELPHYRASVTADALRPETWSAPTDLEPPAVVYDGSTLFHGPLFHALEKVGVSELGAEATVRGAQSLGWQSPVRGLDQPALDGAMQLAVLWAQYAGAGPTLPMGVSECRVHCFGPIPEGVRCVVRGGHVEGVVADCDVALIDAEGAVRLELLGVRLVARPN